MNRFITPLLLRLYAWFAVFLLIYGAIGIVKQSDWNKERLYRQLLRGNRAQKISAAGVLVELGAQRQLVRALKADSGTVRDFAERGLWEIWYHAAGEEAFRMTQAGSRATDPVALNGAMRTLNQLVQRYPKFAEGWNRRATVFWQLGQYERSIADCDRVVALNPDHFGAWEGKGLCQFYLGDLEGACRSFRAALRIHPYDVSARMLLAKCEELLRWMPRRMGRQFDTA